MKEVYRAVGITTALYTSYLIITHAFSVESRQEILKRDGYKCQWCGSNSSLEAAHTNHNRNNPMYDDSSMGITLCSSCHLKQHQKNEGNNGLTRQQNNWAINQIRKRITTIYSKQLPMPF